MEKKKLTTCKACGEEVAKSAKICPKCGAKVKKANPIVLGILIAVVVIAIASAAGGEDEPKKVETNQPAATIAQTEATEKKEEKNQFYVGETAALKGVEVSLLNVAQSTGSTYNTPQEGNVFVLCEFDIYNNSNEDLAVSSLLSFEAYCDDYTCSFSLSALMEKGSKNQLDGTVAAGKRLNGVIGYEVPADWQELEIHFNPSIWVGKDMVFIAENK